MNFDERVFCLMNPLKGWTPVAFGVRLLNRADCLVGFYVFEDFRKGRKLLGDIMSTFREAQIYALDSRCKPGVVCKMIVDAPNMIVLDHRFNNFEKLRIDLLGMRASNPKPFLALRYDLGRAKWSYSLLPALACVNSNYSYIPN